jgi:hypothetical protein
MATVTAAAAAAAAVAYGRWAHRDKTVLTVVLLDRTLFSHSFKQHILRKNKTDLGL